MHNLSIAFLLFSINLRNSIRQVMVVKDHTPPGAVPDEHAPFYGKKLVVAFFVSCTKIDELQ